MEIILLQIFSCLCTHANHYTSYAYMLETVKIKGYCYDELDNDVLI